MRFEEHRVENLLYLTSKNLQTPHGFSTRLGGVSEGVWSSMNLGTTRGDDPACVQENYRRFCAAAGTNPDGIVMANQVHSAVVRPVTATDVKRDLYAAEGYTADGLITDVPGLALVVFAADCIPILLYEPSAHVIAAVHAGWRGTAADIAGAAVRQGQALYGAHPERICAAIGPGIGPCCFETHGDVVDAMYAAFGSAANAHITALGGGKFRVGLKGLNALCLTRAGVLPQNIDHATACTACHPTRFWSHRVHGGDRGSLIGMIQLP